MILPFFSSQRNSQNISLIKRDRRGFTLVELLIVIAIIGILISVGMASFQRAQTQARDGQRRADIQNVAGALELFYSDHNVYPQGLSTISVSAGDCTTAGAVVSWGTGRFECEGKTYLSQLPQDPQSSKTYHYFRCPWNATNPQFYILLTRLEIDENPTNPGHNCPWNPAWSYVIPQ